MTQIRSLKLPEMLAERADCPTLTLTTLPPRLSPDKRVAVER